MIKRILISFLVCSLLEVFLLGSFKYGTFLILPVWVMTLGAYVSMVIFSFIFRKKNDTINFILSGIAGYTSLVLMVWCLDGNDFFTYVVDMHRGREWWGILAPFVIANLLVLFVSTVGKFASGNQSAN